MLLKNEKQWDVFKKCFECITQNVLKIRIKIFETLKVYSEKCSQKYYLKKSAYHRLDILPTS